MEECSKLLDRRAEYGSACGVVQVETVDERNRGALLEGQGGQQRERVRAARLRGRSYGGPSARSHLSCEDREAAGEQPVSETMAA